MIINHCFNFCSFTLAAALITSLGLVTHATAQEHTFLIDLNSRKVTDLGGGYMDALALNDNGQVTGYSELNAFITGPNGMGMRKLGSLIEGYGSQANDINNAGQLVGESVNHAFITGPDGMGMRDLGTLGGRYSVAAGINEVGQVVGGSETTEREGHAFITGPDGMGMRDLGTLGGNSSFASGINDAGQVVGNSSLATGINHAFITGPNGMGMRELVTLGGDTSSGASDINNAGQVVGGFIPAEGESHTFITGPDGIGMRYLGILDGSYASIPLAVNDSGQVVGVSMTGGLNRAFVTGPDGMDIVDLNSLVDLPPGMSLLRATDINNNGQLIASGGFISAPIPELETYALMLAGLGLIGFVAWRQKSEDRVFAVL